MATDYSKFMSGFNSATSKYGNGWSGTSILDQYRNANSGLGYLKDNWDAAGDNAMNIESGLKAQKGNAAMSGIATGLSGLSDIAGNVMRLTQIKDTSAQQNQINDLSRVGLFGYSSYDQLQRDYNDTNFNVPISYKDIRGMSGGEKAGAIGSSTLSGAMTGLQIGGPWGALIGGVIGAGAGIGGVIAGDRKAQAQKDFLENQATIASDTALANMGAASDYLGEKGARWREAHMVAKGGPIRRQSLQEFADRVLGTKTERQPIIKKTYCKGGLKISIK